MTQIHSPIAILPPKFENTTHEVVNLVVQDLCKKVVQSVCFDTRQRSGSVPSQKKPKQSDLQSVSTMTGTLPSHKSDKRIQDIISSKRVQIKVPQQKKDQKTKQINKETTWCFDKKGYMVSSGLDITTIKYYFIKVAAKFGMIVMRDLQDIITVKTQKIDSIRCLFMMCLPLMSDRSVYQLQRYKVNKGCKVRLSFISGTQNQYDQFKKSFFYQLWDKGVLSLTNLQALNLLCFANRNIIADSIDKYEQASKQFEIKILGTEQQIQNWQNQLMKGYKRSQQNLKQVVFQYKNNNNRIYKNKLNEVIIQRIMINEIPICQFYLKKEMNANQQLHLKKKIILQTYCIKKMFEYLEIDSRLLNQKYISSQKLIGQIQQKNLPYSQAIQYLNNLNITLSPLQNIAKIGKFGDKLLECFENQSGKCQSFMDMDSQLPLSIYCCLASNNSQLKPIISLMHDYFQPEDEYQSQNRILAALKAGLQYIRQQWTLREYK